MTTVGGPCVYPAHVSRTIVKAVEQPDGVGLPGWDHTLSPNLYRHHRDRLVSSNLGIDRTHRRSYRQSSSKLIRIRGGGQCRDVETPSRTSGSRAGCDRGVGPPPAATGPGREHATCRRYNICPSEALTAGEERDRRRDHDRRVTRDEEDHSDEGTTPHARHHTAGRGRGCRYFALTTRDGPMQHDAQHGRCSTAEIVRAYKRTALRRGHGATVRVDGVEPRPVPGGAKSAAHSTHEACEVLAARHEGRVTRDAAVSIRRRLAVRHGRVDQTGPRDATASASSDAVPAPGAARVGGAALAPGRG